jgi:hypothetical protein
VRIVNLALYFVHGVITSPQSNDGQLMVGGYLLDDLITKLVYLHYT